MEWDQCYRQEQRKLERELRFAYAVIRDQQKRKQEEKEKEEKQKEEAEKKAGEAEVAEKPAEGPAEPKEAPDVSD